jgi:isoleucyl-tRNA synthetase
LYEIVHRLSRLLAPVLAFTADEIWENIPGALDEAESVHLAEFPAFVESWHGADLLERYERLFELRGAVMKALEEARNARLIGAALEAKVTITAPPETKAFLESFGEDLRYVFIVSKVELREGAELGVKVDAAEGKKCERCWHYTTDVGADARYPGACLRCVGHLTGANELAAEPQSHRGAGENQKDQRGCLFSLLFFVSAAPLLESLRALIEALAR